MADRVKPLKLETPASGGTETDAFPTSLNKNEDFIDCRGVTIQNATSDDEVVKISRVDNNMTLTAGTVIVAAKPVVVPSYGVAKLPNPGVAGQIVYCNDEKGGAVLVFSDGTNWRRVTDRAIAG